MNIMWYIEDIRVLGIIVRVWILKASQLGTCKHLEGVKLWIREKRRKVCRVTPPYSSVYLSYQGERKVCLRIGTDNEEEFRKLASPYFTPRRSDAPCRH